MPPPSAIPTAQQQQDKARTSSSDPPPPSPPPPPSSPTDSEKAQQLYDEILNVLEDFRIVLRDAIEKNKHIDQMKKNDILFSISKVVHETDVKLGSIDGTDFKERMSREEREEIERWLQEKYDEREAVVREAVNTASEEAGRKLAEMMKKQKGPKSTREISETMMRRMVENEKRMKEKLRVLKAVIKGGKGGSRKKEGNRKEDQEKKEGVSGNNKDTEPPKDGFVDG